jgi:hypothetical protein
MLQSSTIALTVYPKFIWDRSCELHPPSESYDWKQHFRCIVARAREVHANPKGIAGAYLAICRNRGFFGKIWSCKRLQVCIGWSKVLEILAGCGREGAGL